MNKKQLIHDLQAALTAHIDWKLKLADFFYGIETLDANAVGDHTQCLFGQWFYGHRLVLLAYFSEFEALEHVHKEVHQSIKELVTMPQEQRHAAEGRQVLAHFLDRCDCLVQMLKEIERKVEQKMR